MAIKAKKTKPFKSLWVTLALAFSALSALVLLISSSANMYLSFQTQQKLITNEQRFIAQNAADTVKSFIKEKFSTLEAAINLSNPTETQQEEQKLVLEKLLGLEPAFRQAVLLDAKGRELANVSRLSSLVSRQLTQRIKGGPFSKVSKAENYISSVYIDDITSEPMVIMAVPATDIFGEFKGALLAEVNLKFMWDLVGSITVGNSGLAYVVDKQGYLIAAGDISRVLRGENLAHLKEVNEFVKGNISRHTDSADIVKGIQGSPVVANHAHLETPEWAVVVELPVMEAYQTVFTTLVVSASIITVSFALAIGFGVYLSKRITKPITILRDAAVKIGEGRLETRIEISKNDEIGILAKSFNQMANDLGKTTTSIANLNHEISVRKEVEESLRDSERRFEEVAENSGDWIWEVNTEGLYTYSSPVVEKILGYRPAEIVGNKHFYDLFAPDQKEKLKKAAFEAFAKKEKFKGLINPNKHKNGSTVILETHGTPITNDKGKLLGYRGVDRDITERKRSEEQLLAVKTMQEFLLRPAPIEQKLRYITDSIVRILGADFARIWIIKQGDICYSGCKHAEATDKSHICRFRDKCLHLMASSGRYTHIDGQVHRRVPFGCYKIGLIAAGENSKFLTNEVTTDPRVHDHQWAKELGLVSFAGYRLAHADGTPSGVLALFSKHPISKEQDTLLEGIAHTASMALHASLAEEELRHEKDFAQSLTDTAQVIMLVLDTNARIVSFNPYMEEISGYKLDEVKGKDWFDTFLPKADHTKIKKLFKQAIGGIQTKGAFNPIIAKDGHEVLIEWYDKTLKDKNGKTIGLIAIGQDITERKQAEKIVENLNKDLRSTVGLLTQSNRQLREFVHLAAHDLKTPLRGISTLAQWLVNDYREKFDDEGRQQINLLIERVDQMGKLINAILQYSTIAREEDKEHPVDLNALVGAVLVEIKPPKNIKININKNLPSVICKESHLRQIFYHLLANAVKFIDKPQGNVAIDYTDRDDHWQFSVSDNGSGIAPQHFERVFQFFQTLDDNDQKKNRGVGLTLARRIVELYNGQIWLTSKLGHGSTFFFTLPKVPIATSDEKLLTAASSQNAS